MYDFFASYNMYLVGLVVVILYLTISIDDFVWDLVSFIRKLRHPHQKGLIDFVEADKVPHKLLAITIAAWREDNVLADVIDNLIASTMYPKSMYHIFLGIYPNDEATLAVAYELAARHDNVHVVENELPGPTSKAQNINYVIQRIKDFEQKNGWRFASLTVHDSEDVVHPYELKVTNYLLNTHQALQFPVFPLIPRPRFKNFLSHLTTGTYADEFAENHFITVPNRDASGAFVPSAGTGFALRRDVIDAFGDNDVLPRDSLTEDYRLSLTLYEMGIPMKYVLERIPRVTAQNRIKYDYVATRSMFPNTFKTAVKQKTRWILGITFQSFRFREIFARNDALSFVARYSMYKDIKANVSNMLVFLGYPILIYVVASFFIPLPAIFPYRSLSWWLSMLVTLMMVERQFMRGLAIYNIYGLRSVFFACLFPPLIPIRLVWGNVINFVSTVRAFRQYFFGNKRPAKPQATQAVSQPPTAQKPMKKLAWAKTDHTFLPQAVLQTYHRRYGDMLIELGYLRPEQLQQATEGASQAQLRLGQYCLKHQLLTENQFYNAMAWLKDIEFLLLDELDQFHLEQFRPRFDEHVLRALLVVPLLAFEGGYVVASAEESPKSALQTLGDYYKIKVFPVMSTNKDIETAITYMYSGQKSTLPLSPAFRLYHETGITHAGITYAQALVVKAWVQRHQGWTEETALVAMGLLHDWDTNLMSEAAATVAS